MYASPFRGLAPLKYLLSPGGVLLLVILIGSLTTERFFCRYLCPLGAVFAAVSAFRLTGIKKPADQCGGCRLCSVKCSMAIPLHKYDQVKSGECINCMKCAAVCPKGNAAADPFQAAAGTLTAALMTGAIFSGAFSAAGNLFRNTSSPVSDSTAAEIADTRSAGIDDSDTPDAGIDGIAGGIADGSYQGSGTGFRGNTNVSVEVNDGKITGINILSYADDSAFFDRAKDTMISRILSAQSTEVDAVSGATYSSNSILQAVAEALGSDFSDPDSRNTVDQTAGNHQQKNGGRQKRARKRQQTKKQ